MSVRKRTKNVRRRTYSLWGFLLSSRDMEEKGKILIIDDNEDVLFALNLLLEPYMAKIKVTTQPARIEHFIRTFQPDVVLLDMNFSRDAVSGQEGFEWLERILAIDPKAVVIFMTAYSDTDKAVRAIKAALDDLPREDHRHTIIHACLPTAEEIAVCERYHINLAVQTAFIDWPQEPDSYLEQILGERAGRLNPIRTFCEHGLILSAGSDGPCTDPDPLLWMYKACNHSNPAESISVQQALRMCTYNGYYTTFDERERGSLEAGKIADMVLLDRNPYDIPKEELASVKVKQLYLRGQEYKKGNGGGAAQILRGMIKRGKC